MSGIDAVKACAVGPCPGPLNCFAERRCVFTEPRGPKGTAPSVNLGDAGAGTVPSTDPHQSFKTYREIRLEAVLREIRETLAEKWSASPEGRAYLAKVDKALHG